jgi:ComF family protein
MRSAGLNLLFPPDCAGCGANLECQTPSRFCPACIEQLELLTGRTCPRCAAAVPAAVAVRDRCFRCRGVKLRFDEAVALGAYSGLFRDWLLMMKDDRNEPLALAIADLIWQRIGERIAAVEPDVVVPVPMHWRRRFVRGTNSPALLADVLARRLGVPLAAGLLRRTRHTRPQTSVPPSERLANVRRAFVVRRGYHLDLARVLLVDDILTTGATCSEAARALKDGGALHVAVVVAARSPAR